MRNWTQEFFEIVADNNFYEDVVVPVAADEPDLKAFYQLKYLGATGAVGKHRKNQLEYYSEEDVLDEVGDKYCLIPRIMPKVAALCLENLDLPIEEEPAV
jgi:hypothetical protein